MAQWQEVQSLANTYLEQVDQLYAGSELPMAVRQCLAAWIEDQNWLQAAEPLSSHAQMLFHSLLALLMERLGSLSSSHEDLVLEHNLRSAHRDLQAQFVENPEKFANLVANLLQEERRILRLGQAGGQGGSTPAPPTPPESGRDQQIQRRLADFHTALQEAERAYLYLEDLQDAFDFCFKVHYQPGQDKNKDPQYTRQLQVLQAKLQNLDQQRRNVLAQMHQLLGRSETLQELLQQELGDWRERQQCSCLGAPTNTQLRPLETWFTELGQGLFQLQKLLRALSELQMKVTYERDPLAEDTPLLQQRLQEQLTHLLKSAFVVEQQPNTPNPCKRPLVLRTSSKFSTRARLLVRLHDRNHRMEAKIHIDRDPPKIKGFRKFNILTSSSKTLLAGDSPQEGLVCDFQYLTLKEQKDSRAGKGSKGASEGPLVVTEELHLITFTLAYAYCGLELELETSTLPFVIISNNNQFSSAWASILWFNMLSSDPKAQQFFSAPPLAPWPRLAEVLSWQFESVVERGLSRDHLLMLGEKLFGSKPSPESTVSWPKFSKDGAAGFSFWAWLDGILGLLQEHLKQLWKDGLILGFVSRKQERKLLKPKPTGTFLIRFSESILGGVTCTWVEHPESGPPSFHSVDPYTAAELASLALPDIIRDYQMMMEENVPENPLQFLYPNTPRDEAFRPYYSQRQEGYLMEPEKYLNRRLIRVSSRQANKSWQTEEELVVATENLETLQLQPGGQGAQWDGGLAQPQPQSLGTPQVTPGNLRTLPPSSPETGQVVTMSPGTVQVTSGSVGTPQRVAVSPGTVQVTCGSVGTPQRVAVSPGTVQVTCGNVGTPQGVAVSPGTVQVTCGNVGTPQGVAVSPGTLQVVATSPEMLQPGGLGTLQSGSQGLEPPQPLRVGSGVSEVVVQVVHDTHGILQVSPGAVGTMQVLPGGLEVLQVVPGDQGMLQVVPGDQGMLQPVAVDMGVLQQVGAGNTEMLQQAGTGSTGMLQQAGTGSTGMLQQAGTGSTGMLQQAGTGSTGMLQQAGTGSTGMLQPGPRTVEPLHNSEGQGTLPSDLRDLELLPGSRDMQELLQGLEPGSGTLETLEVADLMPNMLETLDGRPQLGSKLADTSVLLDYRDPFLPQPEESALPTVNSLFASTDFPPLHIDASDFQ